MPVSRIPPAAPTARFSVSESVALFVAILDMCFFGLLSSNKLPAVCVVFELQFRLCKLQRYMWRKRERERFCDCLDVNVQTLRNERVTLCECVATNFYCVEKFVCCFFLVCRVNKSPEPNTTNEKGRKTKKSGTWHSIQREREKRSLLVRGSAKKKGKHLSNFSSFLSSSEKSLLILPVQ